MQQADALWVYLDCNWLPSPALTGCLQQETVRGGSTHSFSFDRSWLFSHAGIRLSEDLENVPGKQLQKPKADIFGCFADMLPDRWGRLLIERSEELAAAREGRVARTFSAFDMLCGLEDSQRMGALRIKRDPSGPFLNAAASLSIPPLACLRELAGAAAHFEECEERQTLPEEKRLLQLVRAGASLGGTRPKASVRDEAGGLWIAKFPSVNDNHDVGAWEHFAYLLAKRAGIETAASRLIPVGGRFHAFLVKL